MGALYHFSERGRSLFRRRNLQSGDEQGRNVLLRLGKEAVQFRSAGEQS